MAHRTVHTTVRTSEGMEPARSREIAQRGSGRARRALAIAGIRAWDEQIIDGVPGWLVRTTPTNAVPGTRTESFIHPDDLQRVRLAYQRAIADLHPFHVECRVADGTTGYHLTSCWCSIVQNGSGQPGRLVVLERPIDTPNGRTGDGANAPHDQDADASSHHDAELMAMLSHELRSPVATISGNASLLLRNADRLTQDARSQALLDVAEASERVCTLIEDIMTLARAWGTRALSGDLAPVSLGQLATAAVIRQRKRYRERRIRLRIVAEAPVLGVSRCIDQIIDNLLTNAMKYSPSDSLTEVVVNHGERDVTMSVLDRGIGFDPGEVDNIFIPFYRSTRVRQSIPGTGIGLAVCKRLAEVQCGKVWARPRTGGGSEFVFSLPRLGDTLTESEADGARVNRNGLRYRQAG